MFGNFNFYTKKFDKKIPTQYFIDFEKNPQLRQIPVKNVILFANARDEKNIKEWAAHHLLIGFSLVYIFDHKSQVPLKEVFKNFDNRVIIERCEMNTAPKLPLMSKAAEIACRMRADWFIYLDADEFIILNKFAGVKQMLSQYHFADALSLNWVMFGTNYQIKEPEGLIIENYTKSDTKMNDHVKTFVRPSQVSTAMAQSPHTYNIVNPGRSFAITGESMANQTFNSTKREFWKTQAFIAHYLYQSEETYKNRKINLPRDDNGGFRGLETDIHSKHNDIDNFIPRKYAENIKTFLKQYE
jgi:hypothetical protein